MMVLLVIAVLAVALLACALVMAKANREPPIVSSYSVEHAYVLQRLCSLEFDVEQLQKRADD